ncbi:MAG: toll/interleukin-1 receptor domain-containing protein, partial [Gammaproteobacteria bacterium]|nr:toll/interleukin-1 receptor domain-containing protein [Gammaproteobacteria bacterium]
MVDGNTTIPIQIYLSYRCKHEDSIAAREILEQRCTEAGFKLVYDESSTRQGDSLIEFMDDLVSARFVFLFLTPDYFQSAWCMYELIHLHENAHQDLYHITLPFNLSAKMSLKVKQQVERFWNSDDNIAKDERAFLAEQIKLNGNDTQFKQDIWQRIETAWNELIQPFLETRQDWLQPGTRDTVLSEQISKLSGQLDEEISKFHHKFTNDLSIELKKHFKPDKLRKALQAELQVETADNLAYKLLNAPNVFTAITTIIRVVKNLQRDPSAHDDWGEWYVHGEDLCALLLLNSVDKTWWYQNQL